jgi:2-polyprenyl-6-hydroxyphenyl methylase/3-demethylubiquinone-9 3-methyltransferase
LSWQITPIALTKAITDPDPAAAKRAFDAMMEMKKIDIATIEAARRGSESSHATSGRNVGKD